MITAATVRVDGRGLLLQPERRSKFGRNHGCSRATIVADPQHLANIWAKGGLAIACAAF